MRKIAGTAGLIAIVAVMLGLFTGSAVAAGPTKLVEGTVYDTTCAAACIPECPPPPHCGPVTQSAQTNVVCAQQRRIVCPLALSPRPATPSFCIRGEPCGVDYPVYAGEGAIVNLRRRGSATVLAELPIVEGHFKIRLGPGQYVFHPRLPEEGCWTGEPWLTTVSARTQGPIPISLNVSNSCVAHPDQQ